MRRILGLSLILVIFAAACGSSGGATSPSVSAPAGTQGSGTQATQTAADPGSAGNNNGTGCGSGKYLTYTTTTFCGSAKATVKVDSTTYELTQGVCFDDPSAGIGANIGTTVIGGANLAADAPNYFAVIQQPGQKAMATGLLGGQGFIVTDGLGSNTVTFAADKKSGTVNGTDLTGKIVVASFTC